MEVEGVVLCLLGGVCRQEVPAVDLRPAGDAGFDTINAKTLTCIIQLSLIAQCRTEAYEAHLEG